MRGGLNSHGFQFQVPPPSPVPCPVPCPSPCHETSPGVVTILEEYFRCHVKRRTAHSLLPHAIVQMLGKTEVGQLKKDEGTAMNNGVRYVSRSSLFQFTRARPRTHTCALACTLSHTLEHFPNTTSNTSKHFRTLPEHFVILPDRSPNAPRSPCTR